MLNYVNNKLSLGEDHEYFQKYDNINEEKITNSITSILKTI